jgi:hypothetical protein
MWRASKNRGSGWIVVFQCSEIKWNLRATIDLPERQLSSGSGLWGKWHTKNYLAKLKLGEWSKNAGGWNPDKIRPIIDARKDFGKSDVLTWCVDELVKSWIREVWSKYFDEGEHQEDISSKSEGEIAWFEGPNSVNPAVEYIPRLLGMSFAVAYKKRLSMMLWWWFEIHERWDVG